MQVENYIFLRVKKKKKIRQCNFAIYRIFQLEGIYTDHLVQLPDQLRANQKLKHVITGFVQMPQTPKGSGHRPPLYEACSSV